MMKRLLISALVAGVIFSGCATKEQPIAAPMEKQTKAMPQGLFQSVPMEQATLMQEGKNKLYCPTCGMNLPMYYKTNHAATHEGKVRQYCSLHCAVEEKELKGMDLKELKAVDAKTLQFIDAKSAHYVIGSNKPGTMTMTSLYAFADMNDAEAFVKENGGTIGGFDAAWQESKKDFSPAMMEKMKAKKALAAEKGGMIYKQCTQTTLPKFASVADAKSHIAENKLCEGVGGAELQMVGMYLFSK